MQNQQNKTMEEKRKEARMALEGDERRRFREEQEMKVREAERLRKEKEEQERITKEKALLEEKKRMEMEKKRLLEIKNEKERKEEENKRIRESEKLAEEKALLEKIKPKSHQVTSATIKKNKTERVSSKKETPVKPNIQTIRTYKNDTAEVVKNKKESIVKIILKERKKQKIKSNVTKHDNTPRKKNSFRKIFFITTGIIVILSSGSALIYQVDKSNLLQKVLKSDKTINKKTSEKQKTITASDMPISIITADTFKKIPASDVAHMSKAISDELKNTSGINSIKYIYITKGYDTKNVSETINTEDLFSLWENTAPAILKRALTDGFMPGIYSSSTGVNTPFLILTTDSYNQAFAGMFSWENGILNDFNNLFGIKKRQSVQGFEDKFIKNTDFRVLRNKDNEDELVYAFVRKKFIIISTNTETVLNIISILSK